MGRNIFYILIREIAALAVFLFLPFPVIASQPVDGWKSNVEVEGSPLTITWQNEQNRPKVIAWMQDFTIPQPYTVSQGDNKLTIIRKGVNSIPERLLIVPENRELKPAVIKVSQETMEIRFNPEAIPSNEVWFWGFTPPDPCPPPIGVKAMSISVRLIHKKAIHESFHGASVWHITLDKEDKYEIPFYFYPDTEKTLKSISIKGFDKADDISQSLCHAYSGGECQFTLGTNKDVWGKSHQINFEENTQFNRDECPLH